MMTAALDQVKTLHEAGLFSSSRLLVSVQFFLAHLQTSVKYLIATFTQPYLRLCERLNPEIAKI